MHTLDKQTTTKGISEKINILNSTKKYKII